MADVNSRVVVGEVRIGFAHTLINPEIKDRDGKSYESYGCTVYVPKSDKAMVEKLKAAVAAAKTRDADKFAGAKIIKSPLLDGDEMIDSGDDEPVRRFGNDQQAADHYILRVNTFKRPDMVKKIAGKFVPLTDAEVYSGIYAYVSLNAAGYGAIDGGKPGVKFYLSNICKTRDGERLGGGAPSAAAEFADIDVPECAAGETPSETDDDFKF